MRGHTRGPWRWVFKRFDGTSNLVGDDGTIIYRVEGIDGEMADDNLVAAAPELLEALILLEREMVESGNAGSKDFGWKPAIEKTRAAIAKAKGES